jgi:hypothetical protein
MNIALRGFLGGFGYSGSLQRPNRAHGLPKGSGAPSNTPARPLIRPPPAETVSSPEARP